MSVEGGEPDAIVDAVLDVAKSDRLDAEAARLLAEADAVEGKLPFKANLECAEPTHWQNALGAMAESPDGGTTFIEVQGAYGPIRIVADANVPRDVQGIGWEPVDRTVPATPLSAEQRAEYEAAAKSFGLETSGIVDNDNPPDWTKEPPEMRPEWRRDAQPDVAAKNDGDFATMTGNALHMLARLLLASRKERQASVLAIVNELAGRADGDTLVDMTGSDG